MMGNIKEKIQISEKYKGLYLFIKKIKHYYIRTFLFNIKMSLRLLGITSKRYKNLRELKNIHKNQRCFIIATGPSLTMDDLKKLKDEKTFGMNSLFKVFGDMGWETSYYGVQDFMVYDKLKEGIAAMKESTIIVGDQIKKSRHHNDKWCVYPHHMLNHAITYDNLTVDFSGDSFKRVYDGYTITYSLIQIAVYMGFKEIYLLGCDCNYSDEKEKQHFVSSGVFDPTYKTAGSRMQFAYKKAKEYAETNGIKINNATRGGMLEIFPRVDLDDVLAIKGKE